MVLPHSAPDDDGNNKGGYAHNFYHKSPVSSPYTTLGLYISYCLQLLKLDVQNPREWKRAYLTW